MKTKKISMVLAAVIGMGMMLCSIASAETDQDLAVYFEISIAGKGIMYTRADASLKDTPYIVEKHSIEKDATIYIEIDRTTDEQNVRQVRYDAEDMTWLLMDDYGCAKPTEDGYIVQLTNYDTSLPQVERGIYVEEDGIGIKVKVFAQAKLKEKEGADVKGRLKQLSGTYWGCNNEQDTVGVPHIKKAGALKIKGKLVLFEDLPQEIQDIFEP